MFDVKNEKVRAALQDAPKIGESLCAECEEHFAQVRAYLDAYGVAYTLDPTLVRGLDYYTRTTFEFLGPDESTQASTICGGGRYDYLVEEIGGPPTPGIGFGAGIERLAALARARRHHRRRAAARSLPRARGAGASRRAARGDDGAARARRLGRHRLRGPLGEGPADATRRSARARSRSAAPTAGRSAAAASRTEAARRLKELAVSSWRDTTCGALRAERRRQARDRRRLGGHAPRPRRSRLRRPSRLLGQGAARHQPGAGARGRGDRARDPERVRPAGRRRGRRRARPTR